MAQLANPYRSIPDMFLRRVAAAPDARAFAHPGPDEQPVWLTWAQVAQRAKAIAAGLIGLGVRPEDRVAILCSTRIEWVLADLGIMCAGAATTTIYPASEPEDAAFILRDSGSAVLIAEDAGQAAKITGADLPDLRTVVVIDGTGPDGSLTLAELERRGEQALATRPDLVDAVAADVRPDQLATLIYTSGTTGRPKGVELLHAGWCWQALAQEKSGFLDAEGLHYLWLPLSHSFGKTLICGIIHGDTPTYVDGRIDKLVDNLARVRPTVMCGAPRIFEKVYNRAITTARDAGGAKWKIFSWAMAVGRRTTAVRQAGGRPSGLLAIQAAVADRLVFAKLRARLGGRMKNMVSGSAPLSPQIAEFFYAAGMPVLEGYGLTETSAGSFLNEPGRLRIGTVGTAMGDLECRIDTDGEVLLRGVPVMRGYWHLPEETAAAFTSDGYFRTGDIGELDADGYLRITDRKKDLIKTSGGKYVAPTHVEGLFKAVCPYTSQAIVVGQARNFCTMLVTLDPDAIAGWAAGGPLAGRSYAELAASPEVRELVAGYVAELNDKLNRWETIKKFAILPRDLSIEDGELTPSLKVKRRVVEKSFRTDIDQMYAGSVETV